MKIINKYHKESFYLLMYSAFVILVGAVLMVFTYNELHGAVLIISGTILLTCSIYTKIVSLLEDILEQLSKQQQEIEK